MGPELVVSRLRVKVTVSPSLAVAVVLAKVAVTASLSSMVMVAVSSSAWPRNVTTPQPLQVARAWSRVMMTVSSASFRVSWMVSMWMGVAWERVPVRTASPVAV